MMPFKQLTKTIIHHLINLPGWHTNRKIIVIESDDWGTIRMASKDVFNHLKKNGLPVDKSAFNSNDALESNEDVEALFEILDAVKDKNGNPAVLTVNNNTANPDFDKIKESNFQEYFYEPFTETLKRYPNHDQVMDLYREGLDKKLVKPQFHGREHLNIGRWLNALQSGNPNALMAFEKRMFSVHAEKNRYLEMNI